MPIIPPGVPEKAATSIVRQAEDQKKVEEIAKQQAEMEKRRREQAMRDAEVVKRQQQSSQKK